MARRQLELSNEVAAELAGAAGPILKTLEEHLSADIFLRGNVVTLDGDAEAVQRGRDGRARAVGAGRARPRDRPRDDRVGLARARPGASRPSQVLDDVVWRHRNLKVAPKSVNQKRYVDAIRRSTITFGVGPAGTGKTFLAMAMATAALSRREVNRIILTRPAVEAGERLGFLPGDLMAKVDPYLRPLFDALHDMMDPERVTAHLERGVIEVAPLAFMRGRTLNDSFVILDEAQNTSPEQMKMFLTRLGLRLEDGRDRRHHADRPAARAAVRASSWSATSSTGSTASSSSASAARTSCATSSCSGSSPPTTSTPQRAAPELRAGGPQRRPRVSCWTSTCSAARCAAERGPACLRARRGAAGIEDGHVAVDVRRRRSEIAALNARAPRQGRARPTCCRSRSTATAPVVGERELGDVVICPEHTVDLARRSSTACCTSSGWTTRPTTARCSRCRPRCWRGCR